MQMERTEADFEKIWDGMTTEQRVVYGRQYIDRHIAFADASRAGGNTDVNPVICAMTDAVLSVKPRTRYLVHGGSGRIDPFCVSLYFAFIYHKYISVYGSLS